MKKILKGTEERKVIKKNFNIVIDMKRKPKKLADFRICNAIFEKASKEKKARNCIRIEFHCSPNRF